MPDGKVLSGELVTLKEHLLALRSADQRALEIKETADARALNLAREIQVYKDEKANELRSQIERERGDYATQVQLVAMADKLSAEISNLRAWFDEAHRPVVEFMTSQIATSATRERSESALRNNINTRLVVFGALISAIVVVMNILSFVHP